MLQLRVWILGAVISFNTWGGRVERFNEVSKIYSSIDNCTQNCDLKEFKVKKYDYKVFIDNGVSYGTGMYASYKTDSNENLKKYGIVQFIKGCHFDSEKINGKVKKTFSRSRYHFGEMIKYKHPKWVVDSFDVDPMYASTEENRYWSYKWNRIPGSHDGETEELFRDSNPLTPEIYVSDFPGTAFQATSELAINISLKFKTCIYLRDDIPLRTAADAMDITKAISCLGWSSSFIYNHNKKVYETSREIDPVCLD